MNPNAAQKGKSFKGVVAYITHDEGHAKTSDRVLFTDTFVRTGLKLTRCTG